MSDKDQIVVGEVKNKFSLLKLLAGFVKKPTAFFIRKYKKLPKKVKIVFLLVLVAAAAGAAYSLFNVISNPPNIKADKELAMTNKYVIEKNKAQALAHARKALSYAPDDPDKILAVAALTEKDNSVEAKQLYAHALEVLKKQDNPDASGKKATTYWAAAGLAEKAGQTDQAKQYYQKVIDVADPANVYEQNLLKQSQAALARLQ